MNASKGCGCGGTGKAGCGCGGAAGKPAVWGCSSCGGKGCGACRGRAFVRPNFFGGQLLTEDDLQALVQFVVAKNRLHNRALFGAGVVCGLQIVCDPCDPNKLVLEPGYALDCCGNDIVVGCQDSVDVMQLIQELRARMVGADCGDPCKHDQKDACEEYCLYIKYCEQDAEPVAPYATDDCSPAGCKPTRIYEGYELELRCPTKRKPAQNSKRRRAECIGDEREHGFVVRSALALELMWRPVIAAADRLLESEKPKREELPSLQRAVERLSAIVARPQLDAVEIVEGLQAVITISAHHERAEDGPRETKLELSRALESNPLPKAREVLGNALPTLDEPLLQTWGRAVLDKLTGGNAKLSKVEHDLLVEGAFASEAMMKASVKPIHELRRWVIGHASSHEQTHCTNAKRAAMPSLVVDEATTYEIASIAKVSRAAHDVAILATDEATRCDCDALNPPCASCDDTGVLLACFTVKNCQVVSICNSVREYVITGPNDRYWFPGIDAYFERARRVCCGDPCGSEYASFGRLRDGVLPAAGEVELYEPTDLPDQRTRALLRLLPGLPSPPPAPRDETQEIIARLQRELESLKEQVKMLGDASAKKKAPGAGG